MTTSSAQDALTEVWAIKDSLSASFGHNLKATCRALYAEQAKHPADFVNLGAEARQGKALETPNRPSSSAFNLEPHPLSA
jgi:hypothetical protein